MANPQLEDGYTPIANEILDRLAKSHLAPNEWQTLMFIIRKTYGFHKKVDYIANFQIVDATGLCKAVVSRILHSLRERDFITRSGKYIGIQKDWELWKLAESSTSQKLAIPSTELAESSTKVSSPLVTQKIKDTIQNKDGAGNSSFLSYQNELRIKFTDLDFETELTKFNLYWSEGKRKLRNPKLALFNWLTKAREIKNRPGGNGHKNVKELPAADEIKRTWGVNDGNGHAETTTSGITKESKNN